MVGDSRFRTGFRRCDLGYLADTDGNRRFLTKISEAYIRVCTDAATPRGGGSLVGITTHPDQYKEEQMN